MRKRGEKRFSGNPNPHTHTHTIIRTMEKVDSNNPKNIASPPRDSVYLWTVGIKQLYSTFIAKVLKFINHNDGGLAASSSGVRGGSFTLPSSSMGKYLVVDCAAGGWLTMYER